MSDQPVLYSIHIPGALYGGLQERDAFANNNPVDQAALRVFEAASCVKVNSGFRYVMTGEKQTIEYILGYLHSLAELIGERMLTATELGVTLDRLRAAVSQKPVPVEEAP